MRYTHGLKIIRKRKHAFKISLVFTELIIILILLLGFTTLDAQKFFVGFLESFIRIIIAYGFSLLLAISVAILVTVSEQVEGIFLPVLDAFQSFPSFALAPLLIVWLGKTDSVVITILVIEMIWPLLFTLLSAKKQMHQDLQEAAITFGAKGIKYFEYVTIPLLFPAIITGSIVAWGEAWETIIAAEIIVNVPGIGSYLSASGADLNSKVLAVGILLLMTILFILNKYIWLPLLNLSTRYQQE